MKVFEGLLTTLCDYLAVSEDADDNEVSKHRASEVLDPSTLPVRFLRQSHQSNYLVLVWGHFPVNLKNGIRLIVCLKVLIEHLLRK